MTEEKGCVKCGHTEIEEGTLSATGIRFIENV